MQSPYYDVFSHTRIVINDGYSLSDIQDSYLVSESEYFKYIGHNLKILGLMETDSGYFQCVGRNDVGQIHSVAQLIVLDEGGLLVST